MKTTSRCPKCRGSDILRIPGWVGGYGAGNNIPVTTFGFKSVLVSRYLCCGCGYSEEWIDDTADIEKLKAKFRK